MRPYKRRNFFIDKQFQTKYALLTVLLLLVYTLIFVTLIFIPFILPIHFNVPLEERVEAARVLLILHKRVWPPLLAVIPLLGIMSIFITHKIVGPVYRLKKAIQDLTEGNLGVRVTLRRGDDLHELADHVNDLSEELRAVVSALKDDHATLSFSLSELEHGLEARTISESMGREIIGRVRTSRENIEKTLARFNLSP